MATVTVRPRVSLPTTELSWLQLHDHFVATVGDAAGRGEALGPLLVLADATFAPHSRFPLHPHRDMEILSIVVDGELSHHGNQAHDTPVKAREAQLISARGGMVHAEGNVTDLPTRMLQIWFRPSSRGGEAAYFQRSFAPTGPEGRHLVAGDAGMPMRTDATVWWMDLAAEKARSLELAPGRTGYLLAVGAPLRVGDKPVGSGDGAVVQGAGVELTSAVDTSVLWIDLAV